MKIEQMPIRDRFDDIIDKVIAIRSELEDSQEDTVEVRNDLTVLFGRLRKLRDYVLEELNSK